MFLQNLDILFNICFLLVLFCFSGKPLSGNQTAESNCVNGGEVKNEWEGWYGDFYLVGEDSIVKWEFILKCWEENAPEARPLNR